MTLAPVALFVYNRPWHTQQALETLQKNDLSKESELFIYSDAPKDESARENVEKVRNYIKSIQGFKGITIIERNRNFGLSESIISGVDDIISRYGKIIVLEDDLLVSPCFLKFMNDALTFYEQENKVISICGCMYPIKITDRQTALLRMTDCWGWATWRRGWDLFERDGVKLLKRLKAEKLIKAFDLNGAIGYSKMLENQVRGKVVSWAVCWHASSILNNKLSLYPYKSLVKNIGFDGTGTNCGFTSFFNTEICQESIPVAKIPIAEDKTVLNKISMFFWLNKINIIKGIFDKLRKFCFSKNKAAFII